MVLQVPYVTRETIEQDAEALLVEYVRARKAEVKAPIPVEDIVEKYLKLHLEFDDLHRRFGVPRLGKKTDILAAIWMDSGEIVIDLSLDPEEWPGMLGRYRYTVAHEGCGHWRLHRRFLQANSNTRGSTMLCRASQAKERVEWQADFYAACILMPRGLVHERWRKQFGSCNSITYEPTREATSHYRIAERFALMFGVSTEAMRIRLKGLGLLRNKLPPREGRLWSPSSDEG